VQGIAQRQALLLAQPLVQPALFAALAAGDLALAFGQHRQLLFDAAARLCKLAQPAVGVRDRTLRAGQRVARLGTRRLAGGELALQPRQLGLQLALFALQRLLALAGRRRRGLRRRNASWLGGRRLGGFGRRRRRLAACACLGCLRGGQRQRAGQQESDQGRRCAGQEPSRYALRR